MSWVRSTISTDEAEEDDSMTEKEKGSTISTEVKEEEAGFISTEDEKEALTEDKVGSTISMEVKEEAESISMTGRFSSMQVELREAGDRKSQFDS